MKTHQPRRPPPISPRRYPSLSDHFAREQQAPLGPGVDVSDESETEDTFWAGYVRLIGFIVFVAILATLAAIE